MLEYWVRVLSLGISLPTTIAHLIGLYAGQTTLCSNQDRSALHQWACLAQVHGSSACWIWCHIIPLHITYLITRVWMGSVLLAKCERKSCMHQPPTPLAPYIMDGAASDVVATKLSHCSTNYAEACCCRSRSCWLCSGTHADEEGIQCGPVWMQGGHSKRMWAKSNRILKAWLVCKSLISWSNRIWSQSFVCT